METFLFLLELAGTVAFAVSGAVLGIENFKEEAADKSVDVYNISGQRLRHNVSSDKALDGLDRGIYVVGGKKKAVQ